MKKETFAEKMARKSFNSKEVQNSWMVHMQAFGPILEPAFIENYQARVHLTAALNKISRRDIKGGIDTLEKVRPLCQVDADKAAWLFFMGLAFEMAGVKEQMIACYQEAAEYRHNFYLPYLKVAKAAHADAVYDTAEKNYRSAIECFDGKILDEQSKTILASAYSNLASCLTTMHRLEESEEAFNKSVEIMPQLAGRNATGAILYAVMGKKDKAAELAKKLDDMRPEMREDTLKVLDKILNGTHPHFNHVELEGDYISEFWHWFLQEELELREKLQNEDYDSFFETMQSKLKSIFTFMERDPELGIEPQERGCKITFADFYMVSLRKCYEEILAECPEQLAEYWIFEITH